MLSVDIPGRGSYQIEHLVLDVNGTIAEDGHLIPGVKQRLQKVAREVQVHMVTADTHGRQFAIDAELEMQADRLERGKPEDEQKAALVNTLGAQRCIAMGNGANDVHMLRAAAIGVAILGPEGTCVEAVTAADVVCLSVGDALDLLLTPRRLVATLRR
jgi:P-type E1-E2 ATPase